MIGVIGSEESERKGRFVKNFGAALAECLLEPQSPFHTLPHDRFEQFLE